MNQTPYKQRLVPYLIYKNAPLAMDLLCSAFGFAEALRYPMPHGRVAALVYEGNAPPTQAAA